MGDFAEKLKKYGFKEQDKMYLHRTQTVKQPVDYPKPTRSFRIVFESYNLSLEENYFFLLNHLTQDWGLHETIKIKDIFSSSEQSSFWGQAANRLNIQQSQAQNYMALIGKFTKELFPIVRELRILDEKMNYYDMAKKGNKPADIALKDIWISLVEGGGKNPGSVLGLASQLGFATLPDLFYDTFVQKTDEIDKAVEKLNFNKKVKEVLKRKLFSYLNWKNETYKELKARKKFMGKFLKQHYVSIKMYIEWLKPILRNVQRLSMNPQMNDSTNLVSAFEGATLELEFLAYQPHPKISACVLVTMNYRLSPELNYHQDGYQQKGPIHIGKVWITLRSYAWTPEQIENYKKMRDEETLDIIGSMDETLKAAMEALGGEVEKYLEELGELEDKKDKAKKEKPKDPTLGAVDPFVSVFKGFYELFGSLVNLPKSKENNSGTKPSEKDKKSAKGLAELALWQSFKNYKKAHGMLSW